MNTNFKNMIVVVIFLSIFQLSCIMPKRSLRHKTTKKTEIAHQSQKKEQANTKKKLAPKYVGETNKYKAITTSIFVSNGDVYVAGAIKKAQNLSYKACYWKNGILTSFFLT